MWFSQEPDFARWARDVPGLDVEVGQVPLVNTQVRTRAPSSGAYRDREVRRWNGTAWIRHEPMTPFVGDHWLTL